jgi:hypothetical protein
VVKLVIQWKHVIRGKKKVPIMSTATIKSIELVVRIKTQLVKSRKIPTRYPCIIYYNI